MEVFILKLLPVDALTSSAILVGEVASLDHETFDDCKNKQKYNIQRDQPDWQSVSLKLPYSKCNSTDYKWLRN